MANRIFDLQETKGTFQVRGVVNGTARNNFYTAKKTKNGKDFRAVNFGCAYDDHKSVYMSMNGMPQQNVYFSKRNPETGKVETRQVEWANRNKFNVDGFRMIGVNLGLSKTIDANGKEVNDKKTMHQFDACEYIQANLQDDTSVFIRGNIDFSSYIDGENNIRRSIKYVPTQISLCQDVDFNKYDGENNIPMHDFTQTIIFTGIEQEKENDKNTGRFIVSAKIVTYSDIVDTQFIMTDASLAARFKKNLKPYTAIEVSGCIEVSHGVEEVVEDNGWGKRNAMKSVSVPTKIELIIDGAEPSTIDRDTYTEKNVAEAMQKIRAAKTAEQNFTGKSASTASASGWGEDLDGDDDDFDPWEV